MENKNKLSARKLRARHMKRVVDEVNQITGIPRSHIMGETRRAGVVQARQLVMLIFQQAYGVGTPTIGRLLNRHHTTVQHGIRKAFKRVISDDRMTLQVAGLIGSIQRNPDEPFKRFKRDVFQMPDFSGENMRGL